MNVSTGLLGLSALSLSLFVSKTVPLSERAATTPDAVVVGSGSADAPHLGSCPVFPADNVWNTPIDTLPKDDHSDAYIQSIGAQRKVHPDFGADPQNGIPYTEITTHTPPVRVTFDYAEDSDSGPYPIPPDALIEGGPSSQGDRHVLLIEPSTCTLYELYDAHPLANGRWHAGSGIKVDLKSNRLRKQGNTSADAAGLTILPGLIRYDEVQAGAIHHALRFTVPHTQNSFVWPARHQASKNGNPNLPALGARFRLRPGFDLSRYSETNQVILRALQRYGMFLADNGSAVFISGVPDKRWNDDDLHKLGGVTAGDFEVVDESSLMNDPNSGQVKHHALEK